MRGKGAESVEPFAANIFDFFKGFHFAQAAVGLEPEIFCWYVVIGKECRNLNIEFELIGHFNGLTFHLGNYFGDHLAIEVVTHRCNMATLCFA